MSKNNGTKENAGEKEKIPYDTYRQVRRKWGAINPATRIIQGKKTYKRKDKYTDKYLNDPEGLEDY